MFESKYIMIAVISVVAIGGFLGYSLLSQNTSQINVKQITNPTPSPITMPISQNQPPSNSNIIQITPDKISFNPQLQITSDTGISYVFPRTSIIPTFSSLSLAPEQTTQQTFNNGTFAFSMNTILQQIYSFGIACNSYGNCRPSTSIYYGTYNGTGTIIVEVNGKPWTSETVVFGNPTPSNLINSGGSTIADFERLFLLQSPYFSSNTSPTFTLPINTHCAGMTATCINTISSAFQQYNTTSGQYYQTNSMNVSWILSNLVLSITNGNIKTNYGSNQTFTMYSEILNQDQNTHQITIANFNQAQLLYPTTQISSPPPVAPIIYKIGNCGVAC